MTRTVEVSTAVNANVRQIGTVDLDAQSVAAEAGKVPAAVAATCVATEFGDNLIHRTVLTCTALPISVADDAGQAQYGGVQVYTFPEGLICSFGAIISGNLTMGATGTFIDAFTGVNALGSVVATTGATLVAGEATWLQSTANATAAAKVAAISSVSIATQLTEAGSRVFDGTGTAAPVFLNFAIADDVTHTAGTGTFTGTITIAWMKIGDK
jgi:hypothetical protein